MQSCELITFISTLACVIAESYTPEEIALISAALTQLGDTLTTILASDDLSSQEKC